MKKLLRKWIVMVMASFIMSVFSINTSNAQVSVSLQVFYDELEPYGTWVEHRNYGYVWIPEVDRGFVPYGTNGYWINTEYGNTWVSDYSWGWAPFHYGRWYYDDFFGWIWVPDTEWAPAWVAWRSGGGYYGWAPLMPGFGISMSFSYYNRIPSYYWSFVPYRYVTYRNVYRHCVDRPQVVNIIHNTTIVTHKHNHGGGRRNTFFTGPSRNEIERTSGGRVEVYKVSSRNRPGRTDVDRGSVSFYKPDVDRSRNSRSRAMPSRVIKEDDLRKGNRETFEPRKERSTEFQKERRNDNQRDQNKRDRRPNSFDREDVNRSNDRDNSDRDRQKSFDQVQRSSPSDKRDGNRSEDVQRNSDNRKSVDKSRRSQQFDRQKVERSNEDIQRQRSSTPKRSSEQLRKGPSEQKSRPLNKNRSNEKRKRN